MTKAFFITLGISVIITIGLVLSMVITAQQTVIIKNKLTVQVQDLKENVNTLTVKVKMRDDILSAIRTETAFGNLKKIKLQIDKWEQLKQTEKEK
jgi:hypothetical protein